MRYNRLKDIGLNEQQIRDNLIFTGAKVGDLMKIAMDPKDAKDMVRRVAARSYGEARVRARPARVGRRLAVYLSAQLLSRSERPTGWNNIVFPNVACRTCCGSCRASRC